MSRSCVIAIVIFTAASLFISCSNTQETIVFSGALHGYWDKCGCTQNIGGGIARRATYLKEHFGAVRNDNLLHLDAGGFADYFALDGELKTEAIMASYQELGLKAVNVSVRELADNAARFLEISKKYDLPCVSTNLVYQDSGKHLFKESLSLEFAGRKLKVFGITRKVHRTWKDNNGKVILTIDPAEAIRAALNNLHDDELVILLAYMPRRDVSALMETVKGIDLVLGADGFSKTETPGKTGDTLILYPGDQGKNMVKIGLSVSKSNTIDPKDCELIFLPEDLKEDHDYVKLFQSFGLSNGSTK